MKDYGLSAEDCLLELTLTVTPDITVSNPRSYRNSIEYSTEDSPAPAGPALDLVFIQNFQELVREAVLQNLPRKRTQTISNKEPNLYFMVILICYQN